MQILSVPKKDTNDKNEFIHLLKEINNTDKSATNKIAQYFLNDSVTNEYLYILSAIKLQDWFSYSTNRVFTPLKI
jgi:hypothetical protein